jgi:hypothetical protein
MCTCGHQRQRENMPMPGRSNPYKTQKRRARRQVKALAANVRKTLRDLAAAYPDTDRSQDILSRHQQRQTAILHPKMKRPRYVLACDLCGKPTNQSADLWTDNLVLKLLWSCVVLGLGLGIGYLFGWWAIFVPVVGLLVTFSFLYTITVPFLLLLAVIFILSILRM